MKKKIIQRYLSPLILSLVTIACAIFVSCGDEGEIVTLEPPAPQQPQPEEQIT